MEFSTWIEIDLDALVSNIGEVRSRVYQLKTGMLGAEVLNHLVVLRPADRARGVDEEATWRTEPGDVP